MELRAIAERFDLDGYAAPLDVLAADEVVNYRAAYTALETERRVKGMVARPTQQHLTHKPFWELATHPRVMEIVRGVIGGDVVLLATGFFSKAPGDDEKFVAWHQDTTYWGLDPHFAVTMWIAIDDSDVANGCLRVIPGSHRAGLLPHGTADRAGNILGGNQEIDAKRVDERKAIDLELRAGQASMHHGLTVHGFNPNRSGRRRCGMTLRFTTPDVKPVPGVFVDKPMLISGTDRFGHFQYEPWPAFAADGVVAARK